MMLTSLLFQWWPTPLSHYDQVPADGEQTGADSPVQVL